ncbi:hypothetical protein [Bacillus sp. WP8]|uniref:hypothetical protein n=1 Tax=Bacillus sp. WP8 TaxID=756828 RepID=UPI0016425E8D|nr:hypothetical protein [Bacillus sp. WP8]
MLWIGDVEKGIYTFGKEEEMQRMYGCKIVVGLKYREEKKYEEGEGILIEIID